MSAWDMLNIAARIGVALIVIIKLVSFFDMYKPSERLGLGIAGGCSLMTVPVIWRGADGAFDHWAAALFALGVLIYFSGRLFRNLRHDRINRKFAKDIREGRAR